MLIGDGFCEKFPFDKGLEETARTLVRLEPLSALAVTTTRAQGILECVQPRGEG